MNQIIKYYSFLTSIFFISTIYIYDGKKIKAEIQKYESAINIINHELNAGSQVVNQMNQTRKSFIENKNQLKTYGISDSQLMEEIEVINSIADEMKVKIKKFEVDPRNTFPIIRKNIGKDQINLERQSLSFILSGNFLDFGNFLDVLQDRSEVLKIQHCSISLDSLNPKGINAQLEFSTYSDLR